MLSVIIPTIDRDADLTKTLQSIALQTMIPEEIFVIDQSGQKIAQKIVNNFQGKLNIKYIHNKQKSLVRSKNIGVQNSKGDIICILDDDVFLDRDYFRNVVKFFETHPGALGVQGIISNFEEGYFKKIGGEKLKLLFYNIFAEIFLLNKASKVNKFLPSARVIYCDKAKKITNCQWLSGCACYHRKVFSELNHSFDENMIKYCYGEDKLFSYELYKKFSNSLYIDPSIKYEHYPHLEGRLTSSELVQMRILYNYYIWDKVVEKNLKNRILFCWSCCGDLILYFVKGGDWFKTAARVTFDISFKSKENIFREYSYLFNFKKP